MSEERSEERPEEQPEESSGEERDETEETPRGPTDEGAGGAGADGPGEGVGRGRLLIILAVAALAVYGTWAWTRADDDGSAQVAGLVRAGSQVMGSGQPRRALDYFERAWNLVKDDEEAEIDGALAGMALALDELDRDQEAMTLLEENLPRCHLPDPFNILGNLRWGAGMERAAERAYEDALEKDPTFRPALMNLGRLHLLRGSDQRAVDFLERAELRPRMEPDFLAMLIGVQRRRGSVARAAELAEEALASRVGFPSLVTQGLLAHLAFEGRVPEDTVEALDPPSMAPGVLLEVVRPIQEEGEGAFAREIVERGLEGEDGELRPDLLRTLARWEAEAGDLERALELGERLIDEGAAGGRDRGFVARLAQELGRYEEAREHYAAMIEDLDDEEVPWAEEIRRRLESVQAAAEGSERGTTRLTVRVRTEPGGTAWVAGSWSEAGEYADLEAFRPVVLPDEDGDGRVELTREVRPADHPYSVVVGRGEGPPPDGATDHRRIPVRGSAEQVVELSARPDDPVVAGGDRDEATRGSREGDGRERVVLVVLRGGEWSVVAPLLERGLLPFLGSMIRSGTHGTLRMRPEVPRHEALGALTTLERSERGLQAPLHDRLERSRAVPFLRRAIPEIVHRLAEPPVIDVWNRLRREGRVGVPLSLRGRPLPEDEEFARAMEEAAGMLRDHPYVPGHETVPALRADARIMRDILAEGALLAGAVRRALEGGGDLVTVEVEGTHVYGHRHWDASLARPLPGTPAGLLDRVYVYLDAVLARIAGELDGDDTLVVCSDHGLTNPFDHHPRGFFVARGPAVRSGVAPVEASSGDVPLLLFRGLGLPLPDEEEGRAPPAFLR